MARIPDEALERLKREVSLARLIEAQGLTLISQGKDLACRCPWHDGDDTPSCIVSPKTNLWHCFGCDAGGSVIDWVMRMHKVSFRHACEMLAKQHPALAATASTSTPTAAVKLSAGKLRTAQSFSLAAGDQELLDQVIDFYHTTLKSSPEALEYLEKRGLGSMELIEHFRLGYANRTLAYRLAPKAYKAGAELRTALQRVGILRDSGHEHFNGSLVIPVFNPAGDVMEMYGRKITPNLREGTPNHLYLPGEHAGVWNEEALAVALELFLYFQQPFAFEHDGEDIRGGGVLRIVLLDELAQQCFRGFLLNGVHDGGRHFKDSLPVRNGAGTAGPAGGGLFLPAGFADIGAAQALLFIEQQGVIWLPVGKRLGAGFARVGAGLNIPFVHGQGI